MKMKLLCEDFQEIKLNEVKNNFILVEEQGGFKYYVTLESLFNLFKRELQQ